MIFTEFWLAQIALFPMKKESKHKGEEICAVDWQHSRWVVMVGSDGQTAGELGWQRTDC